MTTTDWKLRAEALLAAMQDVLPGTSSSLRSNAHRELFLEYLDALRTAQRGAQLWWDSLLSGEARRSGGQQLATRIVNSRWPVGPVAHKFVIGVIRSFWLESSALNERVQPAEFVRPEDFLLGWLIVEDDGLAEFLSALPYWPIGLNHEGRWI